LPKYHFGLATNNPREASTCCNFLIALSAAAELLACCMCRRRAFRAGSLSLIATGTQIPWHHGRLLFAPFDWRRAGWRQNNLSAEETRSGPYISL
jgi:apolipoprotein N-acyltransferase